MEHLKRTLQGGLIMLFVMWVNHFQFESREIGGFFILLAIFAVTDQIWKSKKD